MNYIFIFKRLFEVQTIDLNGSTMFSYENVLVNQNLYFFLDSRKSLDIEFVYYLKAVTFYLSNFFYKIILKECKD